METISFKLDDAVAQELEVRAGQVKGGSRHTLARQMVVEALTNAQGHQMQQEIAQLRQQVEQLGDDLRHDLATVAVALLVQAGKLQQAQAEAWVRKAILGEQ